MKYLHFLIITLLLSGCASTSKYSENGLPKPEYKIGGGDVYSGIAQKSGAFLVVEEKTNRIISTSDVKKGDPIRYEIRQDQISEDGEGFEKAYGIPFSEARFSAYLIP